MRSAEIVPIRPMLPDFAGQFSATLLNPDAPAPALVTGPRGKRAEKRYNVYRNNVTVSLIAALSSIFPAVERITGPDFFRAMARFHVRETPPSSRLRRFANYAEANAAQALKLPSAFEQTIARREASIASLKKTAFRI